MGLLEGQRSELANGIMDSFEEAVVKYPDLIALKFKNEEFTFRGLNTLSNQLGHYLAELGVGKGDIVGVYINHSVDLVVTILALLKLGAVNLLLDPALPIERLEYIVNDVTMKCVLGNITNNEIQFSSYHILDLNKIGLKEDKVNLQCRCSVEDDAFIFYTSGSTGTPKGVLITHGGVLNDTHPDVAIPPLHEEDVFLFTSPVGTTRITGELFYPWLAGAKVVMTAHNELNHVEEIINHIIDNRVTVFFVVPTVLRELLHHKRIRECTSIRYVQSLGEKLSKDLKDEFGRLLQQAKLINVYGQTETGICTLHYCSLDASYTESGMSVANRSIYILDELLNPVQKNEIGIIFVGGKYLAKGYCNDVQLTRERFIHDPFAGQAEAVMYRTGDMGRFSDGGELQYLGRNDQIVKVGGVRVSTLEIEAHLLGFNDIIEATVIPFQERAEEIQLAAFIHSVNGSEELAYLEWKKLLQVKLPLVMIPARYIYVDHIPRLLNGKADLNKMRHILQQTLLNDVGEIDETASALQKSIAYMWADILAISSTTIDRRSNFLELGGNSVKAVRCTVEIEKLCNTLIPVELLYNERLESIVEYLEKNNGRSVVSHE